MNFLQIVSEKPRHEPCQSYISFEKPKCGTTPTLEVIVETKVSSVTILMCDSCINNYDRKIAAHKNREAAQRRTQTKK